MTQATPFPIAAGSTGYLLIQFVDENGKSQPLSALPTFTDAAGVLTAALTSTNNGAPPAPGDSQFCFKVTAPGTAPLGSSYAPVVAGTNPDGSVDSQVWNFTIPDDDTAQTGAFSTTPPTGVTP